MRTCCIDDHLGMHLKLPASDGVTALCTNHLPIGILQCEWQDSSACDVTERLAAEQLSAPASRKCSR